eukprot:RCo021632
MTGLALLCLGGVSLVVLLVGMWGHSLIAGLMFLCVGLLCEVANQRLLVGLRGLCSATGVGSVLLCLCLANAAFPCTVLFWVEVCAGYSLVCVIPCCGIAFIVLSGLCLVSGLWVWHSLSRQVRGVSVVGVPVLVLVCVTLVCVLSCGIPDVSAVGSLCVLDVPSYPALHSQVSIQVLRVCASSSVGIGVSAVGVGVVGVVVGLGVVGVAVGVGVGVGLMLCLCLGIGLIMCWGQVLGLITCWANLVFLFLCLVLRVTLLFMFMFMCVGLVLLLLFVLSVVSLVLCVLVDALMVTVSGAVVRWVDGLLRLGEGCHGHGRSVVVTLRS